jgi:hypothetical protein
MHFLLMTCAVNVPSVLSATQKIIHILSISATFGGIFGLCMGGSIISIFEIFYRLCLIVIAMAKTLLSQQIQKPRDNVVQPGNVKKFTPQHTDLFFHRMRHQYI